MSELLGIARGHIEDLEETLKDDGFRGPEWDMHRQLLRSAHNTTNGGAGDTRVLSANLGMLTATYVQDCIRQPDRIKKAFGDLHGDICPVVPMIRPGENGKLVMPWETEKKTSWLASALSVEIGGKKLNATGPAVLFVCALIYLLGIRWLNTSVSTEVKSAVNSAIRAQVMEAVSSASVSEGEKK